MSSISRLAAADEHLRAAYGSAEVSSASSTWRLVLRLLLSGPGPEPEAVTGVLDSTAFTSPESLSGMTAGQLVELLAKVPRGPQKASLLRSVGAWWHAEFQDELSPEWNRGVEFYRESLRKIRGLGPATVDELLLFAAGLPVFPIDRGTIRVAVRHGWLDLPVEDEEAQSVFAGGLRNAAIDAPSFSILLSRVASTHCGREPKCDGCPLQPLLPPNGPLNPDAA